MKTGRGDPMRVRVDCLRPQRARMASTHARTRSASRSAQIIQLGRARLERGQRPPAMQNGGYMRAREAVRRVQPSPDLFASRRSRNHGP